MRHCSIDSDRILTAMSELTRRIKSAGHWDITIRPQQFDARRVHPITALTPLLRRCHVEVRGWDFPHIDPHNPIITDIDFIWQESAWQHYAEKWRFYQSGQFVDRKAIPGDWRDRSSVWPPDEHWKRGDRLGIGDTLYTYYEIFEFAARLAHALEGDDKINVDIKVAGLQNRILYVDDPRRWPLSDAPTAHLPEFPQGFALSRTELIANPMGLGITAAQELFRRFGREFTDTQLRDWLEKSLKG
jgi:hypothetical protein